MQKIVKVGLPLLIATLLLATPVLAYLYRAPLAILESNGNAYSMLPIIVNSNNQWMADNGFMEADALDTRVQTLGGLNKPHMVSDNRTATAVPVPANSQRNLYFVTGESDLSALDIIVGYNGYVTIPDAPAIECSDNFTVIQSGWIDTTAGADKNLIIKEDVFRTYIGASDNITSAILSATYGGAAIKQEFYDAGDDGNSTTWGATWTGQTFTPTATHSVTSVKLFLYKVGNPGNVTVSIRETTGGEPTGGDLCVGTTNGNTLPVGAPYEWRQITFGTEYRLGAGTMYAIVCRALTGDGGNLVNWRHDASAPTYASGTHVDSGNSGTTWTIHSNADHLFEEWGKVQTGIAEDASVSAIDVSSGEHIVETWADGVNLYISVDGAVAGDNYDSVALGGASVADTGDDWTIMRNNCISYLDYMTIDVNNVEQLRYQPIAIIDTVILPDRTGTNHGAITWGSNPAGVSASLGSMTSSGQPTIGTTIEGEPGSVLPEATVSDWFGDGTVGGAILANPIRPFITMVSDNTTLTEILVWRYMGVALLLFIAVATARTLRGHLGITVIVVAATMGGLVAVDHNIYPLWLLVLAVGMFLGGIVAERSPSL